MTKTVLDGYKQNGFDESVLETAYQKAIEAELEMKQTDNTLDFGQLKL